MERPMQEHKEMIAERPTLRRMALLASICLLAACSNVTAEIYAKIKSGMEYKEVTSILGNPARSDDILEFKPFKGGDETSPITFLFAGTAE